MVNTVLCWWWQYCKLYMAPALGFLIYCRSPCPTHNLDDQGLSFIKPLHFNLSNMDRPTRSLHPGWHSSLGDQCMQISQQQLRERREYITLQYYSCAKSLYVWCIWQFVILLFDIIAELSYYNIFNAMTCAIVHPTLRIGCFLWTSLPIMRIIWS
jgi:hypothetical protein